MLSWSPSEDLPRDESTLKLLKLCVVNELFRSVRILTYLRALEKQTTAERKARRRKHKDVSVSPPVVSDDSGFLSCSYLIPDHRRGWTHTGAWSLSIKAKKERERSAGIAFDTSYSFTANLILGLTAGEQSKTTKPLIHTNRFWYCHRRNTKDYYLLSSFPDRRLFSQSSPSSAIRALSYEAPTRAFGSDDEADDVVQDFLPFLRLTIGNTDQFTINEV